jgi:hypothetical protein
MQQNEGWPKFWQIVCIFLHDIGHVGTNYLDNKPEKEAHWVLGAALAQLFFGQKGLELVAGHCTYSGYPKNKLYYADKLAMKLMPRWFMIWCAVVEPKLHTEERKRGMTIGQAVDDWRKYVDHNIESGEYRGNHEMYLERKEAITGEKQ